MQAPPGDRQCAPFSLGKTNGHVVRAFIMRASQSCCEPPVPLRVRDTRQT
ncbi:hypothetical protein BURPS305_3677 [Burkholderia pseudomallei 305]|nr:hypothetical protein BURPS305_3677 [Burkholderia pseudomallei 305]EDU10513.1 hypothetical protein BURPS1655_C0633 [Burkholderia pseudomallei 1655]